MKALALVSAIVLGFTAQALAAGEDIVIDPPAEGSVTTEEGLEAWSRIYEVASHPRCSNCHVGAGGRPMWSGPSYGKTRPHGMNIHAGRSRIGIETIPCGACHTNRMGGRPHSAPTVDGPWMLAPAGAGWFGRSSPEICRQLRDPKRNGGRTFLELAEHLGHDGVLRWAWSPGGNREPAPYSLQAHIDDLLAWGTAGMPCPE